MGSILCCCEPYRVTSVPISQGKQTFVPSTTVSSTVPSSTVPSSTIPSSTAPSSTVPLSTVSSSTVTSSTMLQSKDVPEEETKSYSVEQWNYNAVKHIECEIIGEYRKK